MTTSTRQSFLKNLPGESKFVLFCTFYLFAITGLYALLLGPLLPALSAEYDLSHTMGGLLLSAHQAGALLAGTFAGVLAGFIGRKNAILSLGGFVLAGLFMMMLDGNPLWLLVAFLFTGLSRGGINNFATVIINEEAGGAAAAQNFLHGTFAVGALAAPPLLILATRLFGGDGWRLALWAILFLLLVAQFIFAKAKINTPVIEKDGKKADKTFLKDGHFWANLGILVSYVAIEATLMGFIVTYFVELDLLRLTTAQTLITALWLAMLVLRIIIVLSRDAFSNRLILRISAIGTTLAFALLLFATTRLTIVLAVGGLGLSLAAIIPTTFANLGSTLKKYPSSMGVSLLVSGSGGIVWPFVVGFFADRFGIHTGMATVLVALAGLIICTWLGTRRKADS